MISEPLESVVGLALVGVGVPVYWTWCRTATTTRTD
jgi:hypothetical protein